VTDEVVEVQRARPSTLRRTLPWLAGLAILVVIALRVPVDAFRAAITEGPHVALALVTLAITTSVLCTDSLSTWIGLRALAIRRPLHHVLAIRGATYVLFLLNYAVGQGAFGYWLNRTGIPGLRAVGVTLFLIGTNLATLLVVTTLAWLVGDRAAGHDALWWTLIGGCVAFVIYLAIIVAAPGIVARRAVLAPLFDAHLRGHAIAMVGRLPHTAVIVLGHWVAIRTWGIPVPVSAGLALMPAVAVASVLPISPAGLGTTQAALVLFFADYAHGATADDRQAAVLAFAVVYFVYGVASSLAVGLACTPFARRLGMLGDQPSPSRSR
jgi:hypothetical protein